MVSMSPAWALTEHHDKSARVPEADVSTVRESICDTPGAASRCTVRSGGGEFNAQLPFTACSTWLGKLRGSLVIVCVYRALRCFEVFLRCTFIPET